MDAHDPRAWLDVLQAFVQYHLPRVEPTRDMLLPAGLAIALGLLMVFRSAGMARMIVAALGAIAGAWIGYAAAGYFSISVPICSAVGLAIFAALAHRTWRLWIMLATVAVTVMLATALQLDTKSLREIAIPPATPVSAPVPNADQLHALAANLQQQLTDLWNRARVKCDELGPRGAILPIAAAILALIVAWWASRFVAALVMGLLGSILAVTGGTIALCAEWPEMRERLTAAPHEVIYATCALWLIGLIVQARRAIIARRSRPEQTTAA